MIVIRADLRGYAMINDVVFIRVSVIFILSFCMNTACALTYKIPSSGNKIGEIQEVKAQAGDTLYDIAEQYDIGVFHMIQANPKVSEKKLKASTTIIIPSEFELPEGKREGIVLDLSDMRLFYFHPDEDLVSTYPVGVGRQGWSTPVGETTIVSKRQHPDWRPPESIRREAERNGKTLPLIVPAGPHNPLGQCAMNLGFSGILVHGTNKPTSVGLRSSHGCIRMYAEDIKELFHMAPIGTSVRVVY